MHGGGEREHVRYRMRMKRTMCRRGEARREQGERLMRKQALTIVNRSTKVYNGWRSVVSMKRTQDKSKKGSFR